MRARFLTDMEVRALRRVMRPQDWLPFAVAIETGLRVGDVCKVRCDDLTPEGLVYVAEKTGKAGEARLTRRTRQALMLQAARAAHGGSEWLFPSPNDPREHISRQALWKRLKRASARAGVTAQGVSPHSMRKVYGVREYHEHGLDAAREGLQHRDIRTTEIYALADWCSGENAREPLRREDLTRIIGYIADWLGIPLENRQ